MCFSCVPLLCEFHAFLQHFDEFPFTYYTMRKIQRFNDENKLSRFFQDIFLFIILLRWLSSQFIPLAPFTSQSCFRHYAKLQLAADFDFLPSLNDKMFRKNYFYCESLSFSLCDVVAVLWLFFSCFVCERNHLVKRKGMLSNFPQNSAEIFFPSLTFRLQHFFFR